jgi:hypothetical protein
MQKTNTKRLRKLRNSQAGLTLLETVVALGLLLTVAVGILGLGSIAMCTTENQGHLMARTAEYAQDKMEQLLALKFCDKDTNTTVLPAASTGGTGLAGCPAPIVIPATGTSGVGGSSDPGAPVAGYVDYLDNSGNLLVTGAGGAAPTGWKYMRVWQVSSANADNTLKQITVTVKVSSGIGQSGLSLQSTVTALKAYPF